MIILGIDPGFQVTGFGILKQEERKTWLLDYGYLKMPSVKPLPERITIFHDFFTQKIAQWQVSDLALETPFLGKNAQNFLKLGYLRGILYLLAHCHSLQLHEFSPREVKQSLTGFGGAQKDQVARVVMQLFPRLQQQEKYDVTDAIAITLCGLWQRQHLRALH
jgi:crossover junction endodeoxyribonuclease RuvC